MNSFLQTFRKSRSRKGIREAEIERFDCFMEAQGFDLDALRNYNVLRDIYMEQYRSKASARAFDAIRAFSRNASTARHQKFVPNRPTTTTPKQQADFNLILQINGQIDADNYLPNDAKYAHLKTMARLSYVNRSNIGYALVKAYHESGKSVHQFMGGMALFDELGHHHPFYNICNKYLNAYDNVIARRLPLSKNEMAIEGYDDNLKVILDYVATINQAMRDLLLANNAPYPLNFDVRFVDPSTAKSFSQSNHIDLYNLDGTGFDYFKVGGADGVRRLIREAAPDIKRANGQRFTLLIVRKAKHTSNNDSMYIIKTKMDTDSIPVSLCSDYTELHFLLNAKRSILSGLSSSAKGVLGLSHHLHAVNDSKVYLSYGHHKGIVSASNMVQKLKSVFKRSPHRDPVLSTNYIDLKEKNADELSRLFGRTYSCWEPYWHSHNFTAKKNIYISGGCTKELLKFVDESFADSGELYYKLNYTMAMQICDGQTVCICFADGREICLVNTELHKDGKPLYVLLEPNDRSQQWRVLHDTNPHYHSRIAEAFLTVDELVRRYAIFPQDIPEGSNALRNWQAESDQIVITEDLIRTFFSSSARPHIDWSDLQAKRASRSHYNGPGCIAMPRKQFEREAIKSLRQQQGDLLCISQFNKQNKKYHLAKLLPVYLPLGGDECACVGILFKFDGRRTKVQSIAIDLKDMRNKANLIQTVTDDSWLHDSKTHGYFPINHLELTFGDDQYYDDHSQQHSPSPQTPQQWAHNPMLNASVVFDNNDEERISLFGAPQVSPMPLPIPYIHPNIGSIQMLNQTVEVLQQNAAFFAQFLPLAQ